MNYGLRNMNQEVRKIKSFTDLNAWKEAHKLVLLIYGVSKKFPRDEQFGLVNQIRRAVISVSSNIAEGFSRSSYKEKSQFYSMGLGSLTEIQSQLFAARDLQYVTQDEFTDLSSQTIIVNKLINGLIKKSKTMIHDS
jgi:four helix bundle protein